jgi:pimeloyl-ACP methyl ester carboxylesterase
VAAAIAFSTFQSYAQETRLQPVKNIVLVHGAFADASSWSKVIRILQAKGYNVTAVQNPLTSLADDVAATMRVLAVQNGPVILVGHSQGRREWLRLSWRRLRKPPPLSRRHKLRLWDFEIAIRFRANEILVSLCSRSAWPITSEISHLLVWD